MLCYNYVDAEPKFYLCIFDVVVNVVIFLAIIVVVVNCYTPLI